MNAIHVKTRSKQCILLSQIGGISQVCRRGSAPNSPVWSGRKMSIGPSCDMKSCVLGKTMLYTGWSHSNSHDISCVQVFSDITTHWRGFLVAAVTSLRPSAKRATATPFPAQCAGNSGSTPSGAGSVRVPVRAGCSRSTPV